MSLYFVTPAWKRFELTAVCLEQRLRVIEKMAGWGIEAHCVVIADDANLDTARALGFETVERDNQWLGRKFNDGIQHAAQHGAEWIVPIGSDSWIDPWYFRELPTLRAPFTLTSARYCPVTADRLAELNVTGKGAGPYVFHRSLLEGCGFRPAVDEITRHVDSSTVKGIGRAIDWRENWVQDFQYIGFRGSPSISSYDGLYKAFGIREHTNPWGILRDYYPADLVARAEAALREQVASAA